MNKYINEEDNGIEVGSGAGFSKNSSIIKTLNLQI